jgi:hypothetical protein
MQTDPFLLCPSCYTSFPVRSDYLSWYRVLIHPLLLCDGIQREAQSWLRLMSGETIISTSMKKVANTKRTR